MKSNLLILLSSTVLSFSVVSYSPLSQSAETLLSFDFKNGQLESGFDDWFYSDKNENQCNIYNGFNQSKLCSNDNFRFYIYYSYYNSPHKGYARYGYIDSSKDFAVKGNALKVVQTGGLYVDHQGELKLSGKKVKSKSDTLSPLEVVHSDRILPGDLSLYYKTSSSTQKIPKLDGMNRLSVWLYLPRGDKDISQYNASQGGSPAESFAWYPFINSSKGAHYYHLISSFPMGGWTKVQFDAHPSHNNAGNSHPYHAFREGGYEYPGDSKGYFSNMTAFGFAVKAMRNKPSPSAYFIDEVESYYVPYENEETISSLAIGYNPYSLQFDISLEDKYRCISCNAKYELRYSFNPIDNSNFHQAKKVKNVINFNRKDNNDEATIVKSANGYNRMWAAFSLLPEDEALVKPGNTVYFAVKDISDRSQINQDAVDFEKVAVPGVGMISKVNLIKTISYPIVEVNIPLEIDSKSMGEAIIGKQYKHTFSIYGGKPPYRIESTSTLPLGITLNNSGVLSGITTQKGSFSIDIRVTDSEQNTLVHTEQLAVKSPADFNTNQCTTIVDFTEKDAKQAIKNANYSNIIQDSYTASIEKGSTIVVGSNGNYNYQGVTGTGVKLVGGDKVRAVWFNDSDKQISFTPLISLTKPNRPSKQDPNNWFYMDSITIEPKQFKITQYQLTENITSANTINIAANYSNHKKLLLNKIELESTSLSFNNTCTMPFLLPNVAAQTIVDFTGSSDETVMDIAQWQTVFKDNYTNFYDDGLTITVGSNGDYNFQGAKGSPFLVKKGSIIKAYWVNKGQETVAFQPKLSFTDPGRVYSGKTGTWYDMGHLVIDAKAKGVSELVVDEFMEQEYSLVNINVNYSHNRQIILDKIELLEQE